MRASEVLYTVSDQVATITLNRRQITGALHNTLTESSIESDLEMLVSLQSADFREGVAAHFGKRTLMFPGC